MDGKQLIKVYPKQAELIRGMCNCQRLICLAARQCGKSTAYTVFCLWYAIGNKDKSVLICANKFKTAKDILQRIKMAYEELPLWLKPGIVEWNAASIKFDNGCKITAEATSGSSGRGGSINCISGNETINILFNNESYTLPLKRAYDIFKMEKDEIIKNDNMIYINI